MAQEFRPGEIVPQSGIYTVTHDPAHADMPHEVTVIKGPPLSDLPALQGHQLRARPCGQRPGMSARSIISTRRMRRRRNLFPAWRGR
jgi:hypothetical protein